MDNTVSLKNTNKITYKKGKQLPMKNWFYFFLPLNLESLRQEWKSFWWATCNRNGTILLCTYHDHISKTRFIHTQIICCKFFVIIPSITQNGNLTSTTPSPQHLHVTMLSVLGSGKSTDSLPSKMEDRKCCHGHPNSRLFAQASIYSRWTFILPES